MKKVNAALGLILFISVAMRLGVAAYLGQSIEALPGIADQLSYHTLAQRVLGGFGFTFGKLWWPMTAAGAPTAHWSYLYTFFLAAVYALFGPHPLAARLIQAILTGLLQPYLAFLFGRRMFGPVTGLGAALLTAVYAYFIYYNGALMTEAFYITAVLASLYLAVVVVDRSRDPGSSRASIFAAALAFGLATSAAVLLRQLFLLCVPFIFLWMIWSLRKQTFRWLSSLVVAVVVLAGLILPFTAFNYSRFHRFVLLNTNAGFAFFWGNNPVYGTHFQPILSSEQYAFLIPADLRSLDEASLDQALLKLGIQFVRDDPRRYLLLSLSRFPTYFKFWPSAGDGLASNLFRVASFGLLWPFMAAGMVLAGLRIKRSTPQWPELLSSPAVLLILFVLVYTAIHVLTWTLIRYRLPVDAALLIFAGLAMVELFGRLLNAFRNTKTLPFPIKPLTALTTHSNDNDDKRG